MPLVDNIIAYRILSMLVTPFKDTDAYKLGIIDENGNNLIKSKNLKTPDQKDAYSYLHRLVFNLKKILNRMPGGESQTKNLVAAFFLIKEAYSNSNRTIKEERFHKIIDLIDEGYILVEEELFINRFLKEDAVANVTGPLVSTDQPVIKKKNRKIAHIFAREKGFRKAANL